MLLELEEGLNNRDPMCFRYRLSHRPRRDLGLPCFWTKWHLPAGSDIWLIARKC